MQISKSVESGLRWAILLVALALPCLLGYLTAYAFGLLFLVALVWLAVGWRGQAQFDVAEYSFLFAFLALGIAFTVSARAPADIRYVFNFLAFLIYVPFAPLLARGASPRNGEIIGALALAGVSVGAAIGLVETQFLGAERGGMLTSDPLRLADTATILGFVSLLGFIATRHWRRWIYLLGPVIALATILYAGSREAMFAFPPMLAVALFFVGPRWHVAAAIGLGTIMLSIAALTVADISMGARSSTILIIAQSLASGDAVADRLLGIRIELYRAAFRAFVDAPLFGYGWNRLMLAPAPYLPEGFKGFSELPHLHNDLLNFAVSAGSVGILVYLVLLLAPVLACLRSPRDGLFKARLYGCVLLPVGYFFLGIPDSMLSFELHTALYVAWTAVFLDFCNAGPGRDEAMEQAMAMRVSA